MKNLGIKLSVVCFTIGLFLTSNLVFAQLSRFSFEKYTAGNGDILNYRQLNPDYNKTRKFPLVIFLHGMGERGNDNQAQLKWGVQNFATDGALAMHPAFVIAPQCPDKVEWSNYTLNKEEHSLRLKSRPSKPMELLIGLIYQLIDTYPIDTNRIYITGLSMGGFGTYDAIERYPNLFAAAVPVCGAGDVTRVQSIAKIPIWIFHGAEDPVVSPLFSLDMLDALYKIGAHPGFTLYPEVGHFSWNSAYSDPKMMEWMFSQHK